MCVQMRTTVGAHIVCVCVCDHICDCVCVCVRSPICLHMIKNSSTLTFCMDIRLHTLTVRVRDPPAAAAFSPSAVALGPAPSPSCPAPVPPVPPALSSRVLLDPPFDACGCVSANVCVCQFWCTCALRSVHILYVGVCVIIFVIVCVCAQALPCACT